jgi:cytoskeletal protein RodZ
VFLLASEADQLLVLCVHLYSWGDLVVAAVLIGLGAYGIWRAVVVRRKSEADQELLLLAGAASPQGSSSSSAAVADVEQAHAVAALAIDSTAAPVSGIELTAPAYACRYSATMYSAIKHHTTV